MKTLAEETWSWQLLEDGDRLILSVLSGGVAMVDVNIVLDESERKAWEEKGIEGLKPLIKEMQLSPRKFADRQVKLPPP